MNYTDFKRHLLVNGPRLVQEQACIKLNPTLKREHAEAIALEKILAIERIEIVHKQAQQLKQAAVEKERQVSKIRSASCIIRRFILRIIHQKRIIKNTMSSRIAMWYRRESKRRLENLLNLCQKFESLQTTRSVMPPKLPKSIALTIADVVPARRSQNQGLVLQVLALRNLVSPIPSLQCLNSTIHIELELLEKTQNQIVHLETFPMPYSESLVEWDENNTVVTDSVELQDIHKWTGVVRLIHCTRDKEPRCIGHSQVPVDLLQSLLATSQYCLTRWFPLEKMAPQETVRGEIRISLYYDAPSELLQSQQKPQIDTPQTSGTSKRLKRKPPQNVPENTAKEEVPVPPKRDAIVPPPAPQSLQKPKQPYLKRKPYKVQFEQLDWSSVGAKTNSNLAKPKKTQAIKPADEKEPSLGLYQYWNTSANPSNMKLELMHLKQKVELQTIFHRKSTDSKIPSLSREHIQKLQLIQASKYNNLLAVMDEEYKRLKHQFNKQEHAHHKV
ncbi:hypothetical protein THRCLA_04358 [Thraustotheca clavata]|uniref:C2 domain-containing protein n=1 Tax=Thraustotheca clavata TaxID=74557 RepID=A0A1V9ZZ94_9STRA|nr:hypothetical protein THRCLA_04358 [Thraustotheca clavata]